MKNNQNNELTDVQCTDKNDNLFRNFYDLDDSNSRRKIEIKFKIEFQSIKKHRIKRRQQ